MSLLAALARTGWKVATGMMCLLAALARMLVFGDGGTDTASYSASDAGVEVRLNGSTSSGGHAQGDILVNIENPIGSAYGDTLAGNSAGNILTGGAGADTLDGGGHTDTASYADASSRVYIDLTAIASQLFGDAHGDRLSNIENLIGSSSNDTLTGDAGGIGARWGCWR